MPSRFGEKKGYIMEVCAPYGVSVSYFWKILNTDTYKHTGDRVETVDPVTRDAILDMGRRGLAVERVASLNLTNEATVRDIWRGLEEEAWETAQTFLNLQ